MPNKHLLRLLCLCFIISLLLGCSRKSGVLGPRLMPLAVDRFEPIHLEPYWYYDLQLSSAERIERVWLAPKSIYLLSSLNKLYRLDRDQGIVTWIDQPAAPPRVIRQPVESQDKTLVVAHNIMKVYDLQTGRLIQEFALGFSANSDPAFDGQRLFIADSVDRVVAIELETQLKLWTCRAEKVISAQPAYLDSLLISASESGEVLAYDTQTGGTVWPDYFHTRDAVLARPVLTPQACYVASTDSMLYCLRNGGGDELWRYFAGRALRTAPSVANGRVFLPVPDKGLVVLDAATGVQIEGFQFPDGRQYIGMVNDRLYILLDRGRIVCVDAKTGQRLAELRVGDFDFFLGDDTAPRIYLANADGRIVCLHQLGAGLLQLQPAKRPGP